MKSGQHRDAAGLAWRHEIGRHLSWQSTKSSLSHLPSSWRHCRQRRSTTDCWECRARSIQFAARRVTISRCPGTTNRNRRVRGVGTRCSCTRSARSPIRTAARIPYPTRDTAARCRFSAPAPVCRAHATPLDRCRRAAAWRGPQARGRRSAAKHPPRDRGSVFAARRGERSCRMPPPFCGLHDDDHPAGANAPKSVSAVVLVVRNERATGDRRCRSKGISMTTWPWLANCCAKMVRVRLSACPSESLSTTTVLCNRSSIPRVASHSMVCAAADAPSTHGEDTPISDLPFRPTEQPLAPEMRSCGCIKDGQEGVVQYSRQPTRCRWTIPSQPLAGFARSQASEEVNDALKMIRLRRPAGHRQVI